MKNRIVEIRGASIKIKNQKILDNFDFIVKCSEFIYLVGDTGSGKSSLLKCLYRAQFFCEGIANVLQYDVINIKKKQVQELRKKIGIIFQDFKLLQDRNIYQNLEFVLTSIGWKNKSEIKNRIEETLIKVQIEDKSYKLPYELSGGEQQRASIARAIINRPKLIIADEPTGNLDPKKSIEIVNLLKEINLSGSSVIIATHDYDIIKNQPGLIYKCQNRGIKKIDDLLSK